MNWFQRYLRVDVRGLYCVTMARKRSRTSR